MLIFGKGRKSDTDLRTGEILKAPIDFAKKKGQSEEQQYNARKKREGIQELVKKLKEKEVIITRNGEK